MRIQKKDEGYFDLPVNFSMDVTLTNPMLLDTGEQTTPITLPATPNNRQLLGWEWRLDSQYKPKTEIIVFVHSGLFNRDARLIINTIEKENISCTLYFGRSKFYTLIDEKYLTDLRIDQIFPPYYPQDLDNNILELVELLKKAHNDGKNSNLFAVFPVLTNVEIEREYNLHFPDILPTPNDYLYDSSSGSNADSTAPKEKKKLILNGYDTDHPIYPEVDITQPISESNPLRYKLTQFEGEYPQKHFDGDTEINNPIGYGMTPFMNLFYVLEELFRHFNYTFAPNTLRTHLCTGDDNIYILNNVADALLRGYIDPVDLLPKIKIKDFLKQIEINFAGKFIIDEIRHEVKFYRYTEWLNVVKEEELTQYFSTQPYINQLDFSNLDVKDTTLPNSTEKEGVEYIKIASVKQEEGEVRLLKVEPRLTPYVLVNTNTLTMPQQNGIIHLYSAIEIDGEIDDDNKKNNNPVTTLQLVRFSPNKWHLTKKYRINITEAIDEDYAISYKRAEINLFSGSAIPNTLTGVQRLYQKYFDYRKNSNIPITAHTYMPLEKLLQIDTTTPYICFGQELFIESIKYTLPYNPADGQELRLRTKRPYLNEKK